MIELVSVSELKHIEKFSESRVKWLQEKITDEGVWTQPLTISKDHSLVMDGQHRMEVAKNLGLSVVPCICFDYREVTIWSLRASHEVNVDLVIEKALTGDIYPYKTVKHSYPAPIPQCEIPLSELLSGVVK
ncbi:ParB N-terminal domain-containing protein [Gammaproteobacteria bacterium]|nr:ParB N-terminal domain-containing protein [Gammaproteobacteria bacterium]